MKKYFKKPIITALVLLSTFGVFFSFPQKAEASCSILMGPGPFLACMAAEKATGKSTFSFTDWVIVPVAQLALTLMSMITALGGILLNTVIYYTVVTVADGYNIPSIGNTWKVIRDLSNMAFIFVLLYAAIMTIVGQGQDNRKLIINIVVVAVLINFSLFFTKVVIDISNILALLFYDSIAPGSLSAQSSLSWESISKQVGLSNAFMQHLNVQTLFDTTKGGLITSANVITVGIMGSILLLITSFVFFAVSLLFVIRYVVLIIVMVLSPIFFIAHILPKGSGMDKYKNQWKDALIGQAFFAPIYFGLTWVALNILAGITTVFKDPDTSSALGSAAFKMTEGNLGGATGVVVLIINFAIVIIMVVTALVVAKQQADKAGGGMGKLTSWAMGAAGGMSIGMAGALGRNSLGRMGQAAGNSEGLKAAAARGGLGGWAARQTLNAGRKTGEAGFDFRSTGFGKTLDAGKPGNKGGYAGYVKKKAEAEEKFAKSLGPSDKTVAKAEKELEESKKSKDAGRIRAAQNVVDRIKGVKSDELGKRENQEIANDDLIKRAREAEERQKESEKQLRSGLANDPTIKREEEISKDIQSREQEIARTVLPELREIKTRELEAKKRELEEARKTSESKKKEVEEKINTSKQVVASIKEKAQERENSIKSAYTRDANGKIKGIDGYGAARKEEFAKATETSRWAKFRGYNYAAAAKIRAGKSAKDKAAEALRDLAKDTGVEVEEDKPDTTPPPAAPSTPPTP